MIYTKKASNLFILILAFFFVSCSEETETTPNKNTKATETDTTADQAAINTLLDSFETHLKNKDETATLNDIHPESTDYAEFKQSTIFTPTNTSESSLLVQYYFDYKERVIKQVTTGYTITGKYDAFVRGESTARLSNLAYTITVKKSSNNWKIFRIDQAKTATGTQENVLQLMLITRKSEI